MVTRMNQPLGGKYVGAGGALLTPDQVAQQKKVASALLDKAGDTSPVGHWTAGLNRVVQGFLGGRDMYRANQTESQNTASSLERFNARNSGAGAASRVAEALAGEGGGTPDVLGLIREFEGFRDTPYWDVNAQRTGYGSDTVTLADGSVVPVTPGMKITRDDAERDLRRRVEQEFMPRAISAVGQDVWGSLSEPQRAALTSITYNYGSLPQTVARAVSSGDIGAATNAIAALGAHNDGVNAKRRQREAAIFGGAGISSGPSPRNVSEIAELLADQWLPESAKSVLRAEHEQQLRMQNADYELRLQQQDPLRQAQLQGAQLGNQRAQLELDQMRNPVSDYDKRSAVADQFGMQGDARQAFILTGEIPGTPDGFTLGEGQMRFDANGNLIASGGEKTPSPDEYQKYVQEAKGAGQPVLDRLSYEQAKKGKGFSMTLPDGTVVQMGGPQSPGPEFSDTGAFDINTVISDIDAILASDLARITGPIQGSGGNMVDELAWPQRLLAGEEGLTTIERIGNLQNKTWMAARSMLKGGGSITDYESRKAEGAMARLSRVKSESEMRSALKDLRDAVVEGQRKLAKAKGVNAPSSDVEKPQQAEPEQPKTRRRYNPQTRSFE